MSKPLKRADFPPESKWDPGSVYADWKAFEVDFEAAKADLPKLAKFKGRFKEDPSIVADFYEEWERQLPRANKLVMFAQFAMAVDNADQEPKAYVGQVMGLMGQTAAMTAFV